MILGSGSFLNWWLWTRSTTPRNKLCLFWSCSLTWSSGIWQQRNLRQANLGSRKIKLPLWLLFRILLEELSSLHLMISITLSNAPGSLHEPLRATQGSSDWVEPEAGGQHFDSGIPSLPAVQLLHELYLWIAIILICFITLVSITFYKTLITHHLPSQDQGSSPVGQRTLNQGEEFEARFFGCNFINTPNQALPTVKYCFQHYLLSKLIKKLFTLRCFLSISNFAF